MTILRRAASLFTLTALLALLALPPASVADGRATAPAPAPFNVFEAPLMSEMLEHVFLLLRSGRFYEAEHAMRETAARFPGQPQNDYLLATVLAVRGKNEEALAMLSAAVDHGFRDAALLQRDANLDAIRDEPGFRDITERILNSPPGNPPAQPPVAPLPIENGIAPIEVGNTAWIARFRTLFAQFRLPPANASGPVQMMDDAIALRLNRWYASGAAAGNVGDLYDNRDRQHSTLAPADYPQLSFTRYGDAAREAGADFGMNDCLLFNTVTFGNSSTAVTVGELWRSQARLALTDSDAIGGLVLQYLRNHIYVYPAVADYDAPHGDVLTANSPYMIVTKGRSGSDLPFLRAIASILAAFRPEVKAHLVAHDLIAPTVQMLFRRHQASVRSNADYLTHKAHPPVFDAENIDLLRMIDAAQALTASEIPPMPMLEVIDESRPETGIDDFSRVRSETLHDTPGLITRAVRSTAYRKSLTVSATGTKAPPGQTLTYHWVVLRGDADRITITPRNSDGSIVEISVPWHAPFTAPERSDLMTSRVEIGAFVHNGHHYSAPAFINFLYPANQHRRYDASGRLLSISHDGPETAGNYVDPQVFPRRYWRDDYLYDEGGVLLGWERVAEGREAESYTPDGNRIIERDSKGRARRAERVKYLLAKDDDGLPVIRTQGTGQFVTYEYRDGEDRIGIPRP